MTTMLTIDILRTGTLDQLTDELAAAGYDSTQTELTAAREAVAHLIYEHLVPTSYDSESGDVIRLATAEEILESSQTAEGHIDVDGRRCYVAE